MKSTQKKKPGSLNQTPSKKDTSAKKSTVTRNDSNNNEGKEFKGEGHGHDYSTPVAGEDGGTENQSQKPGKKSSKSSTKS